MQVASKKGFYCVRCGLPGAYPLTVRPSATTVLTLFAGLFTWVSAAWREREVSLFFEDQRAASGEGIGGDEIPT